MSGIQHVNGESGDITPKRGRGKKQTKELTRTPQQTAADKQAAQQSASGMNSRLDRETAAIVEGVEEFIDRKIDEHADHIVGLVDRAPMEVLSRALNAIEQSEDRSDSFRNLFANL